MSEPLSEWLRGKGYEPYAEVPDHYGMKKFDLVGLHKDNDLIIVEMKTSLTKGVILQAYNGQSASERVYCAVMSEPRQSGIEKCRKLGLGVLRVQGGAIIELLVPCDFADREMKFGKLIKHHNENVRSRLEHMAPGGVGGLPSIKGIGPAQDVYDEVVKYRTKKPKATWREMFQNVSNHYASEQSMRQSLKWIEVKRVQDGSLTNDPLYGHPRQLMEKIDKAKKRDNWE